MLLAKAAARGIATWAFYAVAGLLFSLLCFAAAYGALWRGAAGSKLGPLVVTLIYVVAIPALAIVSGQAMGLRAALQRVLREKSGALSELALRVIWPVCENVAARPVASTLSDVARAIDAAIQSHTTGAARWLLRKVTDAARLPALLAGGEFLARVRSEPDSAKDSVRTRIEDELRERTNGAVYLVLQILLGACLLLTVYLVIVRPFGRAA